MKIELNKIKIRDLVEGYENNNENGVKGYGGKLDIRPPYQREFVYKDEQRDEVIKTVKKRFPLNIMYWVKNGEEEFEVLDGQQRTISICQYIQGDFSLNYQYFHNLDKETKNKILDYELTIYICEGTDKEKLEWFKIVNISGEKLTPQELRNAVYTGTWLTNAKRYFSKNNCPAYNIGKRYITGKVNRQDYFETALKWISDREDIEIEDYMAKHQHDDDAEELWMYFQEVIDWVKRLFPNYRKDIMKGLKWGYLFNEYSDKSFNSNHLEKEIEKLLLDVDVTKKKGICKYLITGEEKHLNIRAFPEKMKQEVFAEQDGICIKCEEKFKIEDMQADHIKPWSKGGKTIKENCQMLCNNCNRKKSNK